MQGFLKWNEFFRLSDDLADKIRCWLTRIYRNITLLIIITLTRGVIKHNSHKNLEGYHQKSNIIIPVSLLRNIQRTEREI